MPKIKEITCHKIVNSRGDWTISTRVELEDGSVGEQTIPEGASKGMHEAISLPVAKAIDVVSSALNEALQGVMVFDQVQIDKTMLAMDGSKNKRNLGGNSILSVSLACAKAGAANKKLPLYRYLHQLYKAYRNTKAKLSIPTPVFNVLNGGLHARNGLSFQEFMVIPSPKHTYEASLDIGVKSYHLLKEYLEKHTMEVSVGDEGGFAPEGFDPTKALTFIKEAIKANYIPGEDVFFGLDVAAGSFYNNHTYKLTDLAKTMTATELTDYYASLMHDFELMYIEDPFYENQYASWHTFNKRFGKKLLIVGDDLVVTNKALLKTAIEKELINAVIVKPNQVGTLTETFDFIHLAKEHKLSLILSHRSGDTAEDTFIADLAVAVGAEFMKSGSPARGERVAKYNRLLEIASTLPGYRE
jgi:enolase